MGLTVGEMDTYLTLEVVRGDCIAFGIVMRDAVQRAGEGPRSDGDQQRTPLIQVLILDFLGSAYAVAPAETCGIRCGQRLRVNVQAAGPAVSPPDDTGLHVIDLVVAALGPQGVDSACIPVDLFRRVQGHVQVAGITGADRHGAEQLVLRGGSGDAVHGQAFRFLEGFHGGGNGCGVFAGNAAGVVTLVLQFRYQVFHSGAGGTGLQCGIAGFGLAAVGLRGYGAGLRSRRLDGGAVGIAQGDIICVQPALAQRRMLYIIPVDVLDFGGSSVVRQDHIFIHPADYVGVSCFLTQVDTRSGGFDIPGRRFFCRLRCGGCAFGRSGRGRLFHHFDYVAPQIAAVVAVLDKVPGISVLLDRLQDIRQGHVLGNLLDDRSVDGCPQVAAALGGLYIAQYARVNRGGRRCGCLRCRCCAGSAVGNQFHAVVADVVCLFVVGYRIPGVSAFLHGFASQRKGVALADQVIVRIVVAVRACPQMAAGQDQFHMGIGTGGGRGGRGAAGRLRLGGYNHGFTVFRSAAENGDKVAHDIADVTVVFYFKEGVGTRSADGRDRQQFHLCIPVQPGDAVIACSRSFTQVGAAGGNGSDGAGLGGQVLVLAGRCGCGRRGRFVSAGIRHGSRGGNSSAVIILRYFFGSEFTEEIPVNIPFVFVAVLPGRIDCLYPVPADFLDSLDFQNVTDMISRQRENDLLVGSGTVAHIHLVHQRNTLPHGCGTGGGCIAARCGGDQRDDHAQRQSKTQQAAAIHSHERLTSTFFVVVLRHQIKVCKDTELFYYENVTMSIRQIQIFNDFINRSREEKRTENPAGTEREKQI